MENVTVTTTPTSTVVVHREIDVPAPRLKAVMDKARAFVDQQPGQALLASLVAGVIVGQILHRILASPPPEKAAEREARHRVERDMKRLKHAFWDC